MGNYNHGPPSEFPLPSPYAWETFIWQGCRAQHRTPINYLHVPCSKHRTLEPHLGRQAGNYHHGPPLHVPSSKHSTLELHLGGKFAITTTDPPRAAGHSTGHPSITSTYPAPSTGPSSFTWEGKCANTTTDSRGQPGTVPDARQLPPRTLLQAQAGRKFKHLAYVKDRRWVVGLVFPQKCLLKGNEKDRRSCFWIAFCSRVSFLRPTDDPFGDCWSVRREKKGSSVGIVGQAVCVWHAFAATPGGIVFLKLSNRSFACQSPGLLVLTEQCPSSHPIQLRLRVVSRASADGSAFRCVSGSSLCVCTCWADCLR